MRYKIVITCPRLKTAKRVYELIENSKIYNDCHEIINLNQIKEVCDECAKNDN